MKSFVNFAFLIALAIGITGFSASGVEPSPVLSRKEVKALIQTAKTPEDHMKLARYYHHEANALEAVAKDHDEMSTEYFRVPGSRPTLKYPSMGAHCRDLSAYYRQAAEKAEEMAAEHEEIAKNTEK